MLSGRPLPMNCPLPTAALTYKSHYATSASCQATSDSHYAKNTRDYAQNTSSPRIKGVYAAATPKLRHCYEFWHRINRPFPVGPAQALTVTHIYIHWWTCNDHGRCDRRAVCVFKLCRRTQGSSAQTHWALASRVSTCSMVKLVNNNAKEQAVPETVMHHVS